MPSIDLPIDQLRTYVPEAVPPPDLSQFWSETVAGNAEVPRVRLVAEERSLKGVRSYAVRFDGSTGGTVAGWYVRPSGDGTYPGVVTFHGYSGRGNRPLELYSLAAQGVGVLSMDCAGQGGDSSGIPSASGHVSGWLTQGITDPRGYYYRTVYADAVRALEVLAGLDGIDPGRLAVTGVSQGGGIALAAAALSSRPVFAWADVPFLCDFPRAVKVAPASPYGEITDLVRARPELEEVVFSTLAYFDVANLAPEVTCPCVVTVSLWDEVCPPSTIFGMFSRLGSSTKDLRIRPFHRHQLSYENDEARLQSLLAHLT